jgi:hypothetical protein
MSQTSASDETTTLATYTTRRDAEMARDYLEDAGIRAFVQTDDAGGMYPQLQRPHGVQLVGMGGTASRARSLLEEAGLLPDDEDAAASAPESPPAAQRWGSAVYGLVLVLGVLAVGLVLLMIVLG